MARLNVYNMNAEKSGTITVKDDVFGVEYNEALIHEVVVAHLANKRQGSKSTLTRSEVRGHAKKPWRQKGTGRARHGSSKGPQWKGGGIVFAPKQRDYSKKVNKEAKKVAFKSAISAKVASKELIVIDNIELSEVKTKIIKQMIDSFKMSRKVLIVLDKKDDKIMKAASNLSNVSVTFSNVLSTYDIVANTNVIATKSAIKLIEEAQLA